ncbi:MAG: GNAT family N-acetyltransferase [Pseudomonadota bacterium]
MIRQMTEINIPDVIEIAAVMYRESENYRVMGFSPERVREMALMVIKNGFAMVAVQESKIIGIMAGSLVQPAFSQDLMACDFLLYVLPEHRGGMAAVRLVAAYVQWARKGGAKIISVGVTAGINNDAAIAFYSAIGFRQSGVQMMMEV